MERIPVSSAQMQMWFLDQLSPGCPAYHLVRGLRLSGELDGQALARAVTDVVRRHEILRTAYVHADGAPWQVVRPDADGRLEFEDLSAIPPDEVEDVIAARAATLALLPFDFASGRLARFCLFKRDARSHVLVVVMHHICVDGLSLPVVFGEIAEFYAAHHAGRPGWLPEPDIQFADCVLWQLERTRTEASRRHLAYWEKQLADLPPLEMPADRPRPPVPTYCGARVTHDLPADVVSGVRALTEKADVTVLIVMVAAFAATLHRHTGQDEIVVGTATTGRNAPDLAGVVGCFMNSLVLRIDVSDNPTFTELLHRAKEVIFGAWSHREVPFESVVAAVAPQRERSRNPLYQFWIQVVDAGSADIHLPVDGVTVEPYEIPMAITPLDFSLNVIETGAGLRFRVEFATDLFDRSRVERLLGHLERVLAAVAGDPGLRVWELPLLGQEERRLVSQVWQGPAAEQPGEPVHVQIAARAAADPGAVAAVAGERSLSFGELDRRSGLLAGRLTAMGVGAGDVVGVALARGCELPVALVGVLKAGAAFVVVDPEHPAARLAFIFADTRVRAVVADARTAPLLPGPAGWTVLDVDGQRDQIAASAPVTGDLVGADAAAYVLYTSGSTGNPKGVVVEHHALTTFLLGVRDLLGLGPGDRAIHHMALIFDWSIGEIFTALVSGATLVFVAEQDRLSPEAIGDLLEREHVTYLGGPPAMLAAIPRRPYPDLGCVVVGGEAFAGDLVNRWNVPGRRFINGYGPTEAAVACLYYECEHRDWVSSPPIGRPPARRYVYVLDRADNLCPIGVPGEIVVGGAGLARGYLNLPELTAQRFTPDPVRPGGRIYRTGDLGRWTQDGQIQFLGRIDSQVKVNGLRIELEEIESVLTEHPGVAAAAVTVHGEGAARRLVGYVVPAGADTDAGALGGWLAARLPRYMIPTVFTVLDRLPLTRTGKIDRAALPAPDPASAADPATGQPPATPAERQVAAIFAAILGRDHISRDDNFFDLGGTSIEAAQAVYQLRAVFQPRVGQDGDLALADFYAAPGVADIARSVEEARALLGNADGEGGP
jgi:nonribosomal peptide synthetase DhbF